VEQHQNAPIGSFSGNLLESPNAFKAALDNWMAIQRQKASERDLAEVYATSVAVYTAANYRADNLALVKWDVVDRKTNEVVDPDSEEVAGALQNVSDLIKRSELSHCFWGANLIQKRLSTMGGMMGLRWINPTFWELDATSQGIDGFYIGNGPKLTRQYLKPEEVIYTHLVDFNDDYGGVGPAEVAFLQAGIEVEIATTALSFFQNMAIPPAIIQPTSDSILQRPTKRQREQLTAFLQRIVKGTLNFGKTIIMPTRWEWVQLQMPFDKLAMPDLKEDSRNMIFMAMHVPIELAFPSSSGYAQAYEARRAWLQTWLVPTARWYAEQLTEQLIRPTNHPTWYVRPNYEELPGLVPDIITQAKVIGEQVKSTLIDLYTAQKEIGIEPDERLKDLYMVQGVPVPAEELKTYYEIERLSLNIRDSISGTDPNKPVGEGDVLPDQPESNTTNGDTNRGSDKGKSLKTGIQYPQDPVFRGSTVPDFLYKEVKNWRILSQRKGLDYDFRGSSIPVSLVEITKYRLKTLSDPADAHDVFNFLLSELGLWYEAGLIVEVNPDVQQ
jgi:HK97 family phage portal protein